MKLVGVFISTLFLIAQCSAERKVRHDLVVRNISQFPVHLKTPFHITIGPKDKNRNLINSIHDTLVVQISDAMTPEHEMSLFNFGSQDAIDNEFIGEFIRIPVWLSDIDKGIINITIFFTKFAHRQILEIYHLNATTSKDRDNMLDNLKLAKLLYKSNISLLISSKIDLSINSSKDSVAELYLNTDNVARCRAYYGIPKVKPDFINPSVFSNKSINFSKSKNEIEMTFKANLKHHHKNLTCESGATKKSIQIRIFHDPSNVMFKPQINDTLGNGTSIICTASDGYPEPIISWHFTEGPKKAALYYQIKPYAQTLYIKPNAPIGSKWTFSCNSMNIINKVSKIYSKNVTFTIKEKRIAGAHSKPNWTNSSMTLDQPLNISQTIILQNDKISSLNLQVSKQGKDISKLKLSDVKQSIEISKLKNTIKKLENKNKDQGETISKLKKVVDKEIQSLKADVLAIKGTTAKQENNESTVGNMTMSTPVPSKPATLVAWTFYDTRRMRRKRKMAKSKKMYNKSIPFPMTFWVWFGERENLRVTLHMSKLYTSRTVPPIAGLVKMTIFNSRNRSLFQQSSQRFERAHKSLDLEFNFGYRELDQARVLESDEITLEGAVTIDN